MKRPLLPAEKKALAYERDHINIWEEDPHQFRRDWPRTKARSNRAYRWGVRASLDTLALRACQKTTYTNGVERGRMV